MGLSEEEFWKLYPRKLGALLEVHAYINGAGKDEETDKSKLKEKPKVNKGYIDQAIPFI